MVCQSEHLTDESREVRGPFDSAQSDKNPAIAEIPCHFHFVCSQNI